MRTTMYPPPPNYKLTLIKDHPRPACRDCGCQVGERHLTNCDIERCPKCGEQLIGCDCFIYGGEFSEEEFIKFGPTKWFGIFCEEEMILCEEREWFCHVNNSSIKCDRNHPLAYHDLHRAAIAIMMEKTKQD